MTDDESTLPVASRRQRQLESERTRLQGRIERLNASSSGVGPDPAVADEIAELERELAAVDRKLERVILAAEIERQEDA